MMGQATGGFARGGDKAGGAAVGRARFSVVSGYIAREFLFGFTVCFFFFFAVFFVNQILLMAEDILSRKAPLKDVLLLLVYSMPSIIAMSFPFASLVGALMAAGRLSSDSEMLALMAAGIPPRRAFVPFIVLGLSFSLVSFAMNDYFLPRGSIEFGKLSRSLVASTPALELKPWSSKRYKDITVVTGGMNGTKIKDILIFDRSESGSERVISAGEASLSVDEKHGDVVLRLSDVWEQTVKKAESSRFEWASASSMEYRISMREEGQASGSLGPRDMPSIDLAKVIAQKSSSLEQRRQKRDADIAEARARLEEAYEAEAARGASWQSSASRLSSPLASLRSYGGAAPVDRTLQVYELEYYKKFSIPFGALCFVVLAFPLGLLARRSGRAMGFGLGMLVAVVYWALLLGGTTLGTRLGWSPFWSTWAPNLVVLMAGALLWASRLRKS
jgi:lipopolysaccharide export system permease protein